MQKNRKVVCIMNDDVLIETVKMVGETIKSNDHLNKRLTIAIITLAITFGITILGITALYFLSNYQYPQVNQEVTDQRTTQEIK